MRGNVIKVPFVVGAFGLTWWSRVEPRSRRAQVCEEGQTRTTVLLCCARDDEPAARALAGSLIDADLTIDVLCGVDGDPSVLSSACDRASGPTLCVVCSSEAMNRSVVRRVAGLFSARKGPRDRLVTVTLADSARRGVLQTIRAAAQEIGIERPSSSMSGERVQMREVLSGSGLRAPTSPTSTPQRTPPDVERLARDLHRGLSEVAAKLGDAPRERRTGHGPRTARESVRRRDTDARVERIEPPEALEPPEPPEPPDGSQTRSAERVGDGVPSLIPDSGDAFVRALDTGRASDDELTEQNVVDAAAEGVLETEPTLHASAVYGEASRPRPRRPIRWSSAAIGLVGSLGLLWFASIEGPKAVQATGDSPVEAARHFNEGAPRAGDVVSDVVGLPGPAVAAETRERDAREGVDVAMPPSATVPPAPVDAEALRVDRAVEAGRLRQIGNLLLAASRDEAMTWQLAEDYCQRRRVEELDGWRLPSRAEVRRLAAAAVVRVGTYWTRTSGEQADEAFAYDATTAQMHRYLKMEAIGRPLCIRDR